MVTQGSGAANPSRRCGKSNLHGCGSVCLEPLEGRLLLSVTGTASSKAMTIVYPLAAWNDSGVVDGVIAKDQYSSDYDDGTSHSHSDAYTDGTDPGWYSAGLNGKLRADSHTLSSLTSPGVPGEAMSSAVVDYIVSIHQLKALPPAFAKMIFNVPVKSTFSTQATIVGNPGVKLETGDADAYVEVCLSDGAQYTKAETKLDWAKDQGKADGGGEVTQIDSNTFSNTIAYWASTQNSDYLSISFTAAGSSLVAPTDGALAGTVETYAYSYVTDIEFDQAAFAAVQGAQTFQLSEYFQLVYGVDMSKGPRVKQAAATCTEPQIELASLTGPDNSTGDLTPTFTGGAAVTTITKGVPKTKLLKSGIAILYVDGVKAGVGTVSNGIYTVTPATDLSAGSHSFTVSAGATLSQMGPQSQATIIVIDTSLPRGDTLTATLGVGGTKSLKFTDGDGTIATLSLTAGTAAITFLGDALHQVVSGSTTTLTGTGLHITDFSVSGDTAKAKLTFTCKQGSKLGNSMIDLGGLSTTDSIATISAGGVNLLGDLDLGGSVTSLTLGTVPAGDHIISAASIGTFKVNGDLNDSAISLTQGVVAGQDKVLALGTFIVTGTMNGSTIDSPGHIGKVTVGRLLDSSIFAGVGTGRNALGVLPDEALDFNVPTARLDSLTVSGVKGQTVSFFDSFVAASKLGTITIIGLPTDGTASGGVAGDSLLKQYLRKSGKSTAMSLKGPLSAAQVIETLDGYIARIV
jgi:hypothetical protein